MTDAPVRVRAPEVPVAEGMQPRARDSKGRLMPRAAPAAPAVEEAETVIATGVKRVPLGQHVAKLAYAPRPGYARRWVSDLPGRVDKALAAGWSHVKDPKTKQPVKYVTDPSLGAGGRQGFLMELPEELYEEDQKVKQDSLDEVDEAIYKGAYNQEAGDKRYNPTFAPNKFEVRRGSGKV